MSFREIDWKGQTYKISINFLRIFFVAVLILGGYSLSFNPSGEPIYSSFCNEEQCFNYFYNHPDYCGKDIPATNPLCTTEIMYKGQVLGTPVPFVIKNFTGLVIGLFVTLILLNHFLYNRQFNLKEALADD